jgi:alpha-1,3-mannosyl-glycoprotein beta-1,2-N-acetylglucosaminyltransferase
MQLSFWIFVALICFLAFTIGLNMGLHGILSFSSNSVAFGTKELYPDVYPAAMNVRMLARNETIPSIYQQAPVAASQAQKTSTTDILSPSDTIMNVDDLMAKALSSESYQALVKSKYEKLKADRNSPISSYISESNPIPILLMTCNRPELLQLTINSISSVRGISKSSILVSQDGSNADVKRIISNNNLVSVQNLEGINLRGAPLDGAQRIARHYKYSIDKLFDRFPQAPAVIIVEDDLLFSPDFYEYFIHAIPALEMDPSLFLISAWNDNGFKEKVRDPFSLRRTEFFPGLGWLLPRQVYDNELRSTWPKEHWDHWLRSHNVHKGREIVYPQVPRSYHNGIKGTFMNLDTHNKYFRDIAYNQEPSISWSKHQAEANALPSTIYVDSETYEMRVKLLIESCQHVATLSELSSLKDKGKILCIWIRVNPDPEVREFQPIGEFFGIWHEHPRGSHRGLHEFYWESNYILLLNTYPTRNIENYQHLMPATTSTFPLHDFNKHMLEKLRSKSTPYEIYASSAADVSCDRVCRDHGKRCQQDLIPMINTCAELKKHFPCRDCSVSFGLDQPAFVNPSAPRESLPGMCLINSQPEASICGSSHPVTMRICPCVV